MAKKSKDQKAESSAVYRIIDLVGTSPNSWAEAARNAVEAASRSLRDIRVAEVGKLDVKVEGTNLIYRVKLKLSFKYHGDED